MGARKQFTPEFKREAVQLLEGGSRPSPIHTNSRNRRRSAKVSRVTPEQLKDLRSRLPPSRPVRHTEVGSSSPRPSVDSVVSSRAVPARHQTLAGWQ